LPKGIGLFLDELMKRGRVSIREIPEEAQDVFNMLIEGGFFIPEGFEEIQTVIKRYIEGPKCKALCLTIAPTLDCNLRCYYCYQKRDKLRMTKKVCDKIIDQIIRKLQSKDFQRLAIDWYGGEPLLALDVIEYISGRLIKLTQDIDVSYSATMVTNGTLLNENTVRTISKLHINNIQITMDGPPIIHDANRPFVGGKPTFKAVIKGIKAASKRFDLFVRINVNKNTVSKAFELLDILEENDCFSGGKKILPYISRIGPLSSTCKNTLQNAIPLIDFYRQVLQFQREVLRRLPKLKLEEVLEFPKVLYSACGAQSESSLCIHPSGRVYKCGLEIHEASRGGAFIWEDYWNHDNYRRWIEINPLAINDCHNCLFLPLCMGGCAKYNFEKNHFFKDESCTYWKGHLSLIIKQLAEVHEERNYAN
jgi:uncharacterized protein